MDGRLAGGSTPCSVHARLQPGRGQPAHSERARLLHRAGERCPAPQAAASSPCRRRHALTAASTVCSSDLGAPAALHGLLATHAFAAATAAACRRRLPPPLTCSPPPPALPALQRQRFGCCCVWWRPPGCKALLSGGPRRRAARATPAGGAALPAPSPLGASPRPGCRCCCQPLSRRQVTRWARANRPPPTPPPRCRCGVCLPARLPACLLPHVAPA